jgi:hypothetical protein
VAIAGLLLVGLLFARPHIAERVRESARAREELERERKRAEKRLARERKRQEAEKAAAQREEAERKKRAQVRAAELAREEEFLKIVWSLERLPAWGDERFIRALARRDRAQFLKDKKKIVDAHLTLQGKHDLARSLQQRRPDIYKRFTSSMELLRIAEEVDVLGEPPNLDRYEHLPICEDRGFIDAYARTRTDEILADHERIFREHAELHAHPDYVEGLKRERPHIYERALWEMRAYDAALGYFAKPKRGRTAEDVRAAKLRRFDIKADDEMALADGLLDKLQVFESRLDQRPELDAETRAIMLRKFAESLQPEEQLPGKVM